MPEIPLAVRTRKFSSLLLTLGLSSTIFLKLQHRTLLLVGPVAAEIFGPHPKNCCFTDPGYGLRISVSKRFSGYSWHPVRISQKVKKSIKDNTTISLLILWRSFFFLNNIINFSLYPLLPFVVLHPLIPPPLVSPFSLLPSSPWRLFRCLAIIVSWYS